jgi:hypothetical protein
MTRQTQQIFSWLIAGGLIGLGLIGFDIFFLFIPCVVTGLILAILGLRLWGTRHLWAAFFGLGIVPTLFLLRDSISAYPPCPPGEFSIPAGASAGTTVSCGGPIPTTCYILLICFGAIALIAGIWPFLRRLVQR